MFQVAQSDRLRANGAEDRAPMPSSPTEAERLLTQELENLLAKRPLTMDRSKNSHGFRPTTLQPPALVGGLASVIAEEDVSDFEWVGPGAAEQHGKSPASIRGTEQWLKKARRERFTGRVRHGVAWLLTVLIGGAVVTGSAYLLLGFLPGYEQLVALGQRTLQ
jgi:hypothetical protein